MQKWKAYIEGGAAEDDARVLEKSREMEAQIRELVRETPSAAGPSSVLKIDQASPQKKVVLPNAPNNADLLIDLNNNVEVQLTIEQPYTPTTERKCKGKAEAPVNLLD